MIIDDDDDTDIDMEIADSIIETFQTLNKYEKEYILISISTENHILPCFTKIINESNREYRNTYYKNKYKNDEIFKTKMKEKQKRLYLKKKEKQEQD